MAVEFLHELVCGGRDRSDNAELGKIITSKPGLSAAMMAIRPKDKQRGYPRR
jgi:hypothetical protein